MSVRRFVLTLVFFCAMLFASDQVQAQGCSGCRDNIAGSAPKVQKSFRRGIAVLGVPAIAIFAGVLWIGLRNRNSESEPGL